MRVLCAFLALASQASFSHGFASTRIGSKTAFGVNNRTPCGPLNAIPAEHLTDPAATIQAATDAFHHISASSQWLADASEAVADIAEDAAKDDNGWWAQYLQLFKNALLTVHDTVDPPLRDAGITQTWGISIALFTASVRTLLLPLSYQQAKGTEYTKALKPYQNEIKEKFKNNKEMQNRATAKLFEDSNVNPLSGCLVSLAQFPIFIGLYRSVTLLAQEGRLSEPFLFIPSLGGPVSPPTYRGMDWLLQGWDLNGFPTPQMGWETTLAFLVMPVVLVIGQSLTMSILTPPVEENASEEEKETFEKTQRVLKFLPLLIGYFSLQVPAGLTIYWFTSNVFTTAQSLIIRAYYQVNPPKIDLPEYWDALDDVSKMSPEERRKAAEAGLSAGPSFAEMIEEARYHAVIQREPLRDGTSASGEIPETMKAWVNGEVEMPSHSSSAQQVNGKKDVKLSSEGSTSEEKEAANV